MPAKVLLSLLLLLSIATGGFPQAPDKKVHFGASVMPQIGMPFLAGTLLFVRDVKKEPAFTLGADVIFPLTSHIQVRTGLGYQMSGLAYRDYSPLFPEDYINGQPQHFRSYWAFDLTNHSLGVPVEVKVRPGQAGKNSHFFLTGGFRLQYLVVTTGQVGEVRNEVMESVLSPDYFLFDQRAIRTSMTLGMGYEWKTGQGSFMISPLLDLPMSKVFSDPSNARANGTHQFLGIRLGYY